ncbi:MAG: S9 family peptidase [Anaerolineae bacterium]|nr:S9 family peptidase [Anaerolineae bacterium]
MAKLSRPYGNWSSPLSPKTFADALVFQDVQWDNDSEALVWLENHGPKGVLMLQRGAQAPRALTAELAVRGTVGYGGGGFTVGSGCVYFASAGRLYRQMLSGGSARPITPGFGDVAAPRLSADGRWLLYVYSYEHNDGLALVDAEGTHWPRKFASNTDFIMQPAWHPTGDYAAYIAWNHPQMPWDGTELRLVTLEYDREGTPYPAKTETIAGDLQTAIFQPEFSPDGRWLAYVSDASGWGQLYLYDLVRKTHVQLTSTPAEYAQPAWIQGMRTYGWSADSRSLLAVRNEQAMCSVWRVDAITGSATHIKGLEHYNEITQISVSPRAELLAAIVSAPKIPARVVSLELRPEVPPVISLTPDDKPATSIQVLVETGEAEMIHRRSATENVPADALADAWAISWTGHDGEAAHGLYFPPSSARYEGSGSPPLVVVVHGGPTSQVRAGYSVAAQFLATHGYAVLMPNHRGSTGYGKAYMNKLRGSWGVYDVEDSATGAQFLAAQGLADPRKLVIMGGSAGGFTVLQSLVTKPGFYRAGVSLFGVSNQFALAMDTHKFEERYNDSILGPLPDAADLYRERSPIFHANRIVDPLLVFQGEDDKVVPRNQSDTIVESLKARGVPHEYHVYAGEGHGWRKPETIEHHYTTLLRFLKQYVVFS